MREIQLDITTFEEKIPLHRYLKEKMGFPFYYGGNLDALYDELGGNIDFTQPLSETDYKALIDASVKPELPDYNKLEPWQQWILPLISAGEFKNRPTGNKEAQNIITGLFTQEYSECIHKRWND